jgi:hypothetical protein
LSSIPTARADGSNGPLVLGFFNRSDVEESEKEGSGPYTVFLSAADQLRGYATFVTGGMGLMVDYDIKNRPAVVYVGDKEEKGEPHALALLIGCKDMRSDVVSSAFKKIPFPLSVFSYRLVLLLTSLPPSGLHWYSQRRGITAASGVTWPWLTG